MNCAPLPFAALLLLALAACSGTPPGSPPPVGSLSAAHRSTALTNADIVENVRQLSSRAPGNTEESAGPTPGMRVVQIKSGYAEVIVARANPDGTVSTRCVDSGEGAAAFFNEAATSTTADR